MHIFNENLKKHVHKCKNYIYFQLKNITLFLCHITIFNKRNMGIDTAMDKLDKLVLYTETLLTLSYLYY